MSGTNGSVPQPSRALGRPAERLPIITINGFTSKGRSAGYSGPFIGHAKACRNQIPVSGILIANSVIWK